MDNNKERDVSTVSDKSVSVLVDETRRTATVHHDGVVPAQFEQPISQLLRAQVVLRCVICKLSLFRAVRDSVSLVLHVCATVNRVNLLPVDDNVDAFHIAFICVGNYLYTVLTGLGPCDGPCLVVRGTQSLAVSSQVTAGFSVSQENRTVRDEIAAGFLENLLQVCLRGLASLRVNLNPLNRGERDDTRPRHLDSAFPACVPK